MGRDHWIFTPNRLNLTFWTPNHCAKFNQNRVKIVAVGGRTDRRTV